ncbi:MAG: sugar-binding protein [Propionibacteriaceae bacterium]|jgi:putative multiple sugar transport system substrate-binding protein|nr:sugar-binding protein [Propionibacteriaceae bacterium]
MKLKRLAAGLIGGALALSMAACSQNRTTDEGTDGASGDAAQVKADGGLIGIAMPTKALERWNYDGAHLQEALEGMGYEVTLQYADNKVDQQISQIQNMINQSPKVIVVASIDGTALGPILATAKEKDISIIAYDRLINNTQDLDYYATFDNQLVGTLQGQYIEEQLGLKDGEGPFNLEPFAGSPDDNNAKFFFAGAWDILKPYVDNGQLVVPSGKAPASNDDWASIGILGWDSADAQSEMQNRLNSFYTGGAKVDVVLSPNDSLALGIEQALDGAGYTADDWPLITGQDADLANVKNMMADKQAMTVWKDIPSLGDSVAKMVDQIVSGETVETNADDVYDNGVFTVPTLQLNPQIMTKENVESVLIDSGYYTADQLGI